MADTFQAFIYLFCSRSRRRKVPIEPTDGLVNDCIQRSRLRKQMSGTWDDFQRLGPFQARECLLVELNDAKVEASDDQQRRSAHVIQGSARQIGPAAPRYNGADALGSPGSRHERSRSSGTGAKQPKWKLADRRLPIQPADNINKAVCQKRNVEHIGPISLLVRSQEIEKQRCNTVAV